jgi:hypothetical protein
LVQKFNNFQDGECFIIIADLIIDKYLRFLTQPNRLNITLSHVRDALYIISQVDMYKDNKNLHTSVLMKIVIHCKLNKYNTINDRTDTSAYYNILPSACEELCHTANSDSNRGVSINHSKDEDVGTDDSEDKDIGADNSKNKNIGTDDSKDENVGVNNSKNKDISADDSKDKDIGTDNSTEENNLDWDNNTNQKAIVSDQVPNNKDTLVVSNAGHKGTEQTVSNIPISIQCNHQ